jgi:hypothetical protein
MVQKWYEYNDSFEPGYDVHIFPHPDGTELPVPPLVHIPDVERYELTDIALRLLEESGCCDDVVDAISEFIGKGILSRVELTLKGETRYVVCHPKKEAIFLKHGFLPYEGRIFISGDNILDFTTHLTQILEQTFSGSGIPQPILSNGLYGFDQEQIRPGYEKPSKL